MARSTIVLAAVLSLLGLACVGSLEQSRPGEGSADPDEDGPDAGPGEATSPDALAVECDPIQAPNEDGEHNPGQPCLACHGPGG
jgi:hypothetical protein